MADSLRQRANRHDQDVCAAVECLIEKTKPDKVRWVQREDCELWFHVTCVFMDKDQMPNWASYTFMFFL